MTPEPTDPIVTPEPTEPALSGDANSDGVVDMTDALLVLRYAICIVDSLPGIDNCDVNSDGSIDMTDALLILRTVLEII